MATKKVKKAAKAKTGIRPITITKAFSKPELVKSIAEMAELEKKQALAVIESLTNIIKTHLRIASSEI